MESKSDHIEELAYRCGFNDGAAKEREILSALITNVMIPLGILQQAVNRDFCVCCHEMQRGECCDDAELRA